MNELENLKNRLETSKVFDKKFEEAFENCFACTRVWSAWGYNTMSLNDFIAFDRDDESFNEVRTEVKKMLNATLYKEDEILNIIENLVTNYELFYNRDIENNFSSEYFSDDIFSYIDLSDVIKAAQEYQKYHIDTPKDTARIKYKM